MDIYGISWDSMDSQRVQVVFRLFIHRKIYWQILIKEDLSGFYEKKF